MANVTHASLTGADLHEPKGVSAASSGQVYVADGAGSGTWTTPTEPVFMQKHIAGLTYQNAAGDPTNDITVLAGSARDTSNTEDMTLSASITKQLDVAWAVGDNQGGLDTGAIANGTYHIWLIKRVDTDVVDVLFSASASAPTMPTNYTKKRRIGSFIRTGAAIQTVSVQETEGGGLEVLVNPAQQTAITTSATGTSTAVTGLPTGVKFEVKYTFKGATGESYLIASPDQTVASLAVTLSGTTQGTTVTTPDGGGDTITAPTAGFGMTRCDTSGQLKFCSAGGTDVTITFLGWKDFRRD